MRYRVRELRSLDVSDEITLKYNQLIPTSTLTDTCHNKLSVMRVVLDEPPPVAPNLRPFHVTDAPSHRKLGCRVTENILNR